MKRNYDAQGSIDKKRYNTERYISIMQTKKHLLLLSLTISITTPLTLQCAEKFSPLKWCQLNGLNFETLKKQSELFTTIKEYEEAENKVRDLRRILAETDFSLSDDVCPGSISYQELGERENKALILKKKLDELAKNCKP